MQVSIDGADVTDEHAHVEEEEQVLGRVHSYWRGGVRNGGRYMYGKLVVQRHMIFSKYFVL